MRRLKHHSEKNTFTMRRKKKLSFIERKKLQYLCNVLFYVGNNHSQENFIEMSFNYLTRNQLQAIKKESLTYLEKVLKDKKNLESIKNNCKNESVDDAIKTLFHEDKVKKRISRTILTLLDEVCLRDGNGTNDITEKS
jgi:sugar diacid utilization regulator